VGYERSIQTLPAVSAATGISRFTLVQAAQRGDFGEDVYKLHGTRLLDTQGEYFRQWRAVYPRQRCVKGRQARQQQIQDDTTAS
jgi:hypothetical protein